MIRTATISPCGQFRYRLGRRWSEGRTLLFVMLNPSTADAEVDDRTIVRCIGFAQAEEFGALEVVNLFAFRTPKPAALKAAGYPVGPDNDAHIKAEARAADTVCLAWGAHGAGLHRRGEVLELLRGTGKQPWCLALTEGGEPAHPLMLRSSCRLMPFEGA